MNKKIILLLCVIVSVLSITAIAEADTNYEEPAIIRCTCYTADDGAITASGSPVRDGIVAGKREWSGAVACVWSVNPDGSMGDFIGYYEFKDTGGHEGLKNGTRIDMYCESLNGCYDWINQYGDYVYVQIVRGEG